MSCQSLCILFPLKQVRYGPSVLFFYSYRDTTGSTLVARLLGTYQAANTIRVSRTAIAAKVAGSVLFTRISTPPADRLSLRAAPADSTPARRRQLTRVQLLQRSADRWRLPGRANETLAWWKARPRKVRTQPRLGPESFPASNPSE